MHFVISIVYLYELCYQAKLVETQQKSSQDVADYQEKMIILQSKVYQLQEALNNVNVSPNGRLWESMTTHVIDCISCG